MGYYKEMKIRPTMLVDRVELALAALGMANLNTFRCYESRHLGPTRYNREIYTGSSLAARAIECMERKLGLTHLGPLGERFERAHRRIWSMPHPCQCAVCRVDRRDKLVESAPPARHLSANDDAPFAFWLGELA